MPFADARARYLALNGLAWVMLAALAAGTLAGARRVGMEWTKRRQARELITSTRGSLQQGKVQSVQDSLEQALALYPALWPEVSRELGPQLAGLPSVLRLLDRISAAGETYGAADSAERSKLLLMQGDLTAARHLLENDPRAGAASAYLLGQVLFEQADFAEAKDAFDQYWNQNRARRDTAVAAIERRSAAHRDGLGETLWLLVTAGLWDEAIRRAAAPEAQGLAEGQFVRALQADVAGNRDAARKGYELALELRPGFLVCLRRLAAM